MSDKLDVIIVDDDPEVGEALSGVINQFYVWGDVFVFSDVQEATLYCLNRNSGIAIFIVDVFLSDKSGFAFLDDMSKKFDDVYSDSIMITGHASDDIVNMCVAANINHLLEKPIRAYALQLAVRSIVSKYTRFAQRVLNISGAQI